MTFPRIALIQMAVTQSKVHNLERAAFFIGNAKLKGAQLVVLPEMFNCPYSSLYFSDFSETLNGESLQTISSLAKEHSIWIVAGSIPELTAEGLFNTCCVFNPEGECVGVHRKLHLFDMDVPGKITFKESNTFIAGDSLTVIPTPFGNIGILICYDIRFPEVFRLLADRHVDIVVIPAAFNTTTGPLHWELLGRCRAVDNQMFVLMCGPAQNSDHFNAYGHSMVINPYGEIIQSLSGKEGLLIADLDLSQLDQVRESMPFLKHRRKDLYVKLTCEEIQP